MERIMEFNKPVENPKLIGVIKLMQENQTPNYKKMFWEEFMNSEYLVPVFIDPEPEHGANGHMRIGPGSKMRFPTLTAPDGRELLPAYTDKEELDKWKTEGRVYTCAFTFDDFVRMLLYGDTDEVRQNTAGIVLNPFGSNIIISKDTIANIILGRKKSN